MRTLLLFAIIEFLAAAIFNERLSNHEIIRKGGDFIISSSKNPPAFHRSVRHFHHAERWKRVNQEYDPWTDALCKGSNLLSAMTGLDADTGKLYKPERTTGQSPFGDIINDLTKWGYTSDKVSPDIRAKELIHQLKIGQSMKDNGLDHDGIVFQRVIYHYDEEKKDQNNQRVPTIQQTYTVDGHEYRVTGATNALIVDHVGGAIYATFMMSAGEGARTTWRREPKREELPQLCQFSDVMWGAWNMDLPPKNTKNIKYYYSWDIQNDDTTDIFERILDEADRELEEWPGISFDMDTEQGKRLLGSPNGRVIGYFLSQLKAELGHKTVTKAHIFHSTDSRNLKTVLAFTIADVPGTTLVHQ